MKFIHRLGYYLGGFSIGLIILFFILNKKDASCDYTPNARVKKNLRTKPIAYSKTAWQSIQQQSIDTSSIKYLLQYGDVNFSKSKVDEPDCNLYVIEGNYNKTPLVLQIANCQDTARVVMLSHLE